MEQKCILLAGDINAGLKATKEVLMEHYRLFLSESGQEAMQVLETEQVDLVVMDIKLPDMDAYDFMNCIKKDICYGDIPVVVVTADTDSANEIEAFQVGVMDYIRKPYEPEVLLRRIANVIQIKESRRNLVIDACRDSLTGIWNRRYLEQNADVFCGNKAEGAFLLFDMDNFKEINDNYGHIMGDEVLVRFSDVLKAHAKVGDIVSRLGGDEFVFYIRGSMDEQALCDRLDELISAIRNRVNVIKGEERISVSVGVAMVPQAGRDFMTLYNKADQALYHVKHNGKCGYHLYREEEHYSFMTNKDTKVDLQQLRTMFEEHGEIKGAFHIEYEGFKRIYQFVERCVERSNQEVQIALFTIYEGENDTVSIRRKVECLGDAIVGSMRKGDVATRYNNDQYVVILMDTSIENGRKVVQRVLNRFAEICGDGDYNIKHDIQTIKKTAEAGKRS